MPLHDKFKPNDQPKRILSLDGGGIKGTLTLGILEEIEKQVKAEYGDRYNSLGEYYDLIAGTSTGAIIACGLAIGKSVKELTDLYLNLGGEIFGKGRTWKMLPRDWKKVRALLRESYSSANLENYLRREFGEIAIGDSDRILCGLAINAKRADTYSLWTVANHPDGKYYMANAHLKLWELCRASAAAPYYFKPKVLSLKTRRGDTFDAAFIDGGVSLANNPAWVAFLTATVGSFGFRWPTGAEQLQITSLGTGKGVIRETPEALKNLPAIGWASKIPELFMTDALELNQVLLEGLGKNVGNSYYVDSQFSDPAFPPPFHALPQFFSYERHNVDIARDSLNKLGMSFDETKINSLTEMDHFENMEDLLEIGRKYAQQARFNLI
ncbi:MAG: patatin-like phospholipase family protein [Bacteroidota bacterium]